MTRLALSIGYPTHYPPLITTHKETDFEEILPNILILFLTSMFSYYPCLFIQRSYRLIPNVLAFQNFLNVSFQSLNSKKNKHNGLTI